MEEARLRCQVAGSAFPTANRQPLPPARERTSPAHPGTKKPHVKCG